MSNVRSFTRGVRKTKTVSASTAPLAHVGNHWYPNNLTTELISTYFLSLSCFFLIFQNSRCAPESSYPESVPPLRRQNAQLEGGALLCGELPTGYHHSGALPARAQVA